MIFATFDHDTGGVRSSNLENLYRGCACFLVGGAPSLRIGALLRLESSRGILCAAINNAAKHFRPQLWFCGDHPDCYDRRIVYDPSIIKFAPFGHNVTEIDGKQWKKYPNTIFYFQDTTIPADKILDRTRCTPWYGNTLLGAIHILYRMGIRKIYLYGSDFEDQDGKMYLHDTELNDSQKDANRRLYACQADNIRSMANTFKAHKLELIDCSERSKLKGVYSWCDIDTAIDAELAAFPEETPGRELSHGTVYADDDLKRKLRVTDAPPEIPII